METVKRDRTTENPIIEEVPKLVIPQPSGRGANPQLLISVAKIPIVPKKTDIQILRLLKELSNRPSV